MIQCLTLLMIQLIQRVKYSINFSFLYNCSTCPGHDSMPDSSGNGTIGELQVVTSDVQEPDAMMEMDENILVCAYPRDQTFGSQYVAFDTLGCKR